MPFYLSLLYSFAWEIIIISAIVLIYRFTEALTKAPLLDIVLSLLTWIPWVIAITLWSWKGFGACILGQFLAMQAFCIVHELANPNAKIKIRHSLDKIVGVIGNHLGLWFTIPALPIFLGIRLGQLIMYPGLVIALGFPKYNQAEWINVSRQKFEGLVGHDLVWCLYCDWMTGVYSLGAEMLRSVESFWCPIRFYNNKKCENCKMDFPDLTDKWVKPEASMKDVVEAIEKHYSSTPNTPRSWWGHPERKS